MLGNKAAPARLGQDKAVALQILIRALCRDDADAQLLRQQADTGQRVPGVQHTGQDLLLDLPRDLRVDRLLPGIGKINLHGRKLLYLELYIFDVYSIYTLYTVVKGDGTKKSPAPVWVQGRKASPEGEAVTAGD